MAHIIYSVTCDGIFKGDADTHAAALAILQTAKAATRLRSAVVRFRGEFPACETFEPATKREEWYGRCRVCGSFVRQHARLDRCEQCEYEDQPFESSYFAGEPYSLVPGDVW